MSRVGGRATDSAAPEERGIRTVARRTPWVWVAIWCSGILLSQTDTASTFAHRLLSWTSGISSTEGPTLHSLLQKGFHVLVFGVFGWLLPRPGNRRAWRRTLLLCLVVGVGSELLQLVATNRTPRLFDAALNLTASITALWWRWGRRSRSAADVVSHP